MLNSCYTKLTTLIVTFEHKNAIFCEKSFWVSIITLCKIDLDVASIVFYVKVGVFLLSQNTEYPNSFFAPKHRVNIVHCSCADLFWLLLQLGSLKLANVRKDSLFNKRESVFVEVKTGWLNLKHASLTSQPELYLLVNSCYLREISKILQADYRLQQLLVNFISCLFNHHGVFLFCNNCTLYTFTYCRWLGLLLHTFESSAHDHNRRFYIGHWWVETLHITRLRNFFDCLFIENGCWTVNTLPLLKHLDKFVHVPQTGLVKLDLIKLRNDCVRCFRPHLDRVNLEIACDIFNWFERGHYKN